MANEPLFEVREDTHKDDGLPPELKGKSPKEIVDFYKQRETSIVNEANTRIAAAAAAVPPKAPDTPKDPPPADFWKDPSKAVKDQISATAVSREEFNRASASVQANMIDMSEFLVSQRFADWKTFKPMIDDIMSKCDPWAKTDRSMWESAYYYAKGRNPQLIQPTQAPTVIVPGTERSAGAPPTVTPPEPTLNMDQKWVAEHLGISDRQYLDAQTAMAKIGSLPFTYDNRALAGERK